MDPVVQQIKLKFGLIGTNIEVPKLRLNVVRLAKIKRSVLNPSSQQIQQLQGPLINISPSSLSKIPHKKSFTISRQSCHSRQSVQHYHHHNNNIEKDNNRNDGQYCINNNKIQNYCTKISQEIEASPCVQSSSNNNKIINNDINNNNNNSSMNNSVQKTSQPKSRNRVSTHFAFDVQIKNNYNLKYNNNNGNCNNNNNNNGKNNKKCVCGDCQQCLKDFNYFLSIFSNDKKLPQISAKSWCIWKKGKTQKFTHYYGRRIHKVREIASLTKMITAMTAIDFLKLYNYDPNKVTYQIGKNSTLIGGTSANLQIGEVYTITELLFAMMLPSGNDAAIAISQVIGLLFHLKMKNKNINPHKQNWYYQYLTPNSPLTPQTQSSISCNSGPISTFTPINPCSTSSASTTASTTTNPSTCCSSSPSSALSPKSFSYNFINLMNQKCQKMGLLDTHIYNSHGNDAYDQYRNISTCNQIAKISSQYIQKYQLLKIISNTKYYTVQRYNNKSWQNTNKLLDDGFHGIKTGINDVSGPCLSACYQDYIIVVLNSRSMGDRWVQVKKIVRWIIRKNKCNM